MPEKAAGRKRRIGILCYNLTPASTSVLNRFATFRHKYDIKAYPLFGPAPTGDLPYDYRPSIRAIKTMNLNNVRGTAPEGHITTLAVDVVGSLLSESDMICLMGLQGMPALLVSLSAGLKKKPILAISQTMNPAAEKNRPFIVRLLKGMVLKMATYHVAQTPPTLDTLRKNYQIPGEKIAYIAWDGAAEEFQNVLNRIGASKRDIRAKLGIPDQAHVILFCGTLSYLKGIDVLIRAFRKAVSKYPDSILVIIGADAQKNGQEAKLKRMAAALGISRQVIFAGSLSWEDTAGWYLVSDIFVLPTRRDMWPKVLVEAALSGLPLITTQVCGAAGVLVRDSENGFVIPVDDVDSLARAMVKLFDREIRTRYGRASREIVREFVKQDRNDLYDQAIERCFELYGENRR